MEIVQELEEEVNEFKANVYFSTDTTKFSRKSKVEEFARKVDENGFWSFKVFQETQGEHSSLLPTRDLKE